MFDELNDDVLGFSNALEALNELERNTEQAIIAQRVSERLDVRVKVVIRPANSSERHRRSIEGLTADVSDGGCKLLTSTPVMAGDVFWLAFDEDRTRIGAVFGRCMRCRLVQEDAFELGFKFLNPIDLKSMLR